MDSAGNAYVTGVTGSTDFPTANAFQAVFAGFAGGWDAFVTKLSGLGPPAMSLSPTSVTFSDQVVGTTSAAQTVTLTNVSDVALSISDVALTGTNSGDFAQTNDCGSSVLAGSHCTISVTFAPMAPGTRTGAVSITDNAPDSPQTVALSGTGLDFTVGPASGSSLTQTVAAGQTGTYNLAFTPVGASGNLGAELRGSADWGDLHHRSEFAAFERDERGERHRHGDHDGQDDGSGPAARARVV